MDYIIPFERHFILNFNHTFVNITNSPVLLFFRGVSLRWKPQFSISSLACFFSLSSSRLQNVSAEAHTQADEYHHRLWFHQLHLGTPSRCLAILDVSLLNSTVNSLKKKWFLFTQPSYWKDQKTTSLNNWGYLLKSSWDILQNQRMGIGLVLSNSWNRRLTSVSVLYFIIFFVNLFKIFFSVQVTSVLCYLWWGMWETHWQNKTWHI